MEFSKWWVTEFKHIKFPSQGTIFDYFFDPETHKWLPWSEKVPRFELDPDAPLQVREGEGGREGGRERAEEGQVEREREGVTKRSSLYFRR